MIYFKSVNKVSHQTVICLKFTWLKINIKCKADQTGSNAIIIA